MKLKRDENLARAGAYDEYNKWTKFRTRVIMLAIAVTAVTSIFVLPFHFILTDGGFSQGNLEYAGQYFRHMFGMLTGDVSPDSFLLGYYVAWFNDIVSGSTPFPSVVVGVWVSLPAVTIAFGFSANPYQKTPNIFGDARYATIKDIKSMARRDLVGFDKTQFRLFVVGKYGKELLRMGESFSILLLAPPGTGKSVGFIVPSILSMDECCIFVHDQKPELWDITSNHRSKLGPCFQLKWAAQDEPKGRWVSPVDAKFLSEDLLEHDDGGNPVVHPATGDFKSKPIYYPSWNPLSPKSIPGHGPKREMYIERLASVLCPDQEKGGDKFWTSRARVAIVGLVTFLVAKVEAASDPEIGGTWSGIPEHWHHREASFPMLVDWFTFAQNSSDDGSEDPMRALFRDAVKESKDLDDAFEAKRGMRPMNRAINELTSLMNTPDKTRGGILTTMDEALSPFKNEAVRQRTCASDFAFNELRGIPKPEAKEREMGKVEKYKKEGVEYQPRYAKDEWLPVSIFISVNLEDAKALAVITGIFVDSANAYLVANGPSAIDDRGSQLGPFDFGFLLDEAPQLPKLDTVINGPSVGRSKRVFYVIVGQDFGQFEQKYSKAEVETLKSNTAIKIILSQNNEATARVVSEIAGKITYNKHSYSDGGKEGPSKGLQSMLAIKKKRASESFESTEFLKTSFIMSMPEGKHLVFVQNYTNRPIMCDTPRFFEIEEFAKRAFNLRSLNGPKPAAPMSHEAMDIAAQRLLHRPVPSAAEDMTTEEGEPSGEGAVDRNRFVFIATPQDIRALTRTEFGEMLPKGDLYGCTAIEVPDNAYYCDQPPEEDVFITDNVSEIADFVQGSRYVVFNEDVLEKEINAKLEAGGRRPLAPGRAEFISKRAEDVGESAGDDIYFLGYEGGPSLDIPSAKEQITPAFAVGWVVDVFSFILGIEDQKRLFS